MPIKYNGKNYVAAYWNGVRYSEGRYNDVIVMITPDTNRYLMAKETDVYLKAGEMNFLDYRNNPAFISDTLSNKNLGYGSFSISFTFVPDKTSSYRVLFEVPGFCKFAYNWLEGQGLLLYLKDIGWRAINTAYITQNAVEVRLYRADPDSDVILKVGTYTFTLAKAWTEWEQPVMTNSDNKGEITYERTSSPNYMYRKTYAQLLEAQNYSSYTTFNTTNGQYSYVAWWPEDITKLRIHGFRWTSNVAHSADTDPAANGLGGAFEIYADEERTVPLGTPWQWDDTRLVQKTSEALQEVTSYPYFFEMTQEFNPVITTCINVTFNKYETGSVYSSSTTTFSVFADMYVAPSFSAGELIQYDKNSYRKLILSDEYLDGGVIEPDRTYSYQWGVYEYVGDEQDPLEGGHPKDFKNDDKNICYLKYKDDFIDRITAYRTDLVVLGASVYSDPECTNKIGSVNRLARILGPATFGVEILLSSGEKRYIKPVDRPTAPELDGEQKAFFYLQQKQWLAADTSAVVNAQSAVIVWPFRTREELETTLGAGEHIQVYDWRTLDNVGYFSSYTTQENEYSTVLYLNLISYKTGSQSSTTLIFAK